MKAVTTPPILKIENVVVSKLNALSRDLWETIADRVPAPDAYILNNNMRGMFPYFFDITHEMRNSFFEKYVICAR